MPIITDHYIMLQRNLLYTGVTRARRMVVLVGNRYALAIALANAKVRARHSALAARVTALHTQKAQEL
jgi:exodeoxyribonuclease V alpha subunit